MSVRYVLRRLIETEADARAALMVGAWLDWKNPAIMGTQPSIYLVRGGPPLLWLPLCRFGHNSFRVFGTAHEAVAAALVLDATPVRLSAAEFDLSVVRPTWFAAPGKALPDWARCPSREAQKIASRPRKRSGRSR